VLEALRVEDATGMDWNVSANDDGGKILEELAAVDREWAGIVDAIKSGACSPRWRGRPYPIRAGAGLAAERPRSA